METITVNGHNFKALNTPTEKSRLLMIQGDKGFLGCGWFSVETADKLGERVAIVTGVKSYEDMLNADIVKVSKAAEAAGVKPGMKGEEALLVINS
ncbi:MAG: YunC family protein [Planctomycetota bacterium]